MKKRKLNSKNPKYQKKEKKQKNVSEKLVQVLDNGTRIYTVNTL
mgnify:FL=1|jgi:hypothetical protein